MNEKKMINISGLEQSLDEIKLKLDAITIPEIVPITMGGTGNNTGYVQVGHLNSPPPGKRATAEGINVKSTGDFSHAEGDHCHATANSAHAEGSRTIASGPYSHAEGQENTANGQASHVEGYSCKAEKAYAHAEGLRSTAKGESSHAEGSSTAEGQYSHAEGTATARNSSSHAEGFYCVADAQGAHAEGWSTQALGEASHSEGDGGRAEGMYSHSEGYACYAYGDYSHVANAHNSANNRAQTVIGEYSQVAPGQKNERNSEGMLIIGKGTGDQARANCFRVGENSVWGGTYQSSGADYAEMFEWEDGNPNDEDRVGRFVTLVNEHIRYVREGDSILGITSAAPSVCGDMHDDQWHKMYETDVFGRPVYEDAVVPAVKREDGTIAIPEHTEKQQKLNPKYRSILDYQGRSKRKEWTPVGILGKIVMIQDGTLTPGCYVKPGENGIATKSTEKTNCKVMRVIDKQHAKVFIIPVL